jgi:hypothetical protein
VGFLIGQGRPAGDASAPLPRARTSSWRCWRMSSKIRWHRFERVWR